MLHSRLLLLKNMKQRIYSLLTAFFVWGVVTTFWCAHRHHCGIQKQLLIKLAHCFQVHCRPHWTVQRCLHPCQAPYGSKWCCTRVAWGHELGELRRRLQGGALFKNARENFRAEAIPLTGCWNVLSFAKVPSNSQFRKEVLLHRILVKMYILCTFEV